MTWHRWFQAALTDFTWYDVGERFGFPAPSAPQIWFEVDLP